nr:MAG TPA: hypothetical protein [Caudoviricetes sp.]
MYVSYSLPRAGRSSRYPESPTKPAYTPFLAP